MKYIISFVLIGLFICSPAIAQEAVKKAPTYRERVLSQSSINDLEATEWSRYVYRVIENSADVNSPLFHPAQSNGTQTNLFSLMFNLLDSKKIKAYRFDLQSSDKSEYEEITLKEVLDIYSISHASDEDIPSNEIMSYYVKERWYFDSKTGSGGTQIVAICPVMHRQENLEVKDGPILKNPLFWISMDDLRPYLLRTKISLNSFGDLGKVRNSSLYDYISCRNYKGDIYQVGNRNLYQYFTTPADLLAEQTRLEKQLKEASARFKTLQ